MEKPDLHNVNVREAFLARVKQTYGFRRAIQIHRVLSRDGDLDPKVIHMVRSVCAPTGVSPAIR